MRLSRIVTSALVLALGATTFAAAQTPPPTPVPIVVPTLPPNTPNAGIIQTIINVGGQILQRERQMNANQAFGTVSYFKRFDMQVQCGTNCYRSIHLHQGTVINPRGATPGVGSRVAVYGNGNGNPNGTLEADTITIQQ